MPQSADARLSSLKTRHSSLDEQLLEELRRPVPDTIQVRKLKRGKLRLKDEIAAIELATAMPVAA